MRLEAVRAVDGLADSRADGRETEEAIHRAVSPADGRGDARNELPGADARRDGRLHPACGRVGGRPADSEADKQHTSTDRNGHPQQRDPKPPPSVGRSGFYPGVKFMKSGFQRTSPPLGGRRTS